MKVKSFTHTCLACPSQWEGFLDDDRPFYVRFRWGRLVIRVGVIGDSFDNFYLGKQSMITSWVLSSRV